MAFLAFLDWTPDQPAYKGQGMTVARNVWPRADGRDRPIFGPQPRVTGFNGRPRAVFVTLYQGSPQIFAGSGTGLYQVSGTSWLNRSKTGGYNTAPNETWSFAAFGSLVIATNYGDPPQVMDLSAPGAFADLSADAPHAKVVGVLEPGFVMLGALASGAGLNGVRWSALEDATSWPEPGTTQALGAESDEQAFPTGGEVRAILGAVGGATGAIFQEHAIRRVEYVGPPAFFAFQEVERDRGLVAQHAVVRYGTAAYYLAEDGFYAFDGAQSIPIGAGRVDQFFWKDVNRTFLHRVHAVLDPLAKNIVWAYPSVNSQDGTCDRWLIYNIPANKWRHASDQELAAAVVGFGGQAEPDLDTDIDEADANLDSSDTPLDQGSNQPTQLALYSVTGAMATLTGLPLEAVLETAEFDAGPLNRAWISGARPIVDSDKAAVAIGQRDNQWASPVWSEESTLAADGICPHRVDTRFARCRVRIPAGALWTEALGVEVIAEPMGAR